MDTLGDGALVALSRMLGGHGPGRTRLMPYLGILSFCCLYVSPHLSISEAVSVLWISGTLVTFLWQPCHHHTLPSPTLVQILLLIETSATIVPSILSPMVWLPNASEFLFLFHKLLDTLASL